MSVNKPIKTIFWVIISLIIISKWAGFKNLSGLNDGYYRYSNYGGSFTMFEEPVQGRVANKKKEDKIMVLHYDSIIMATIPKSDTIVYRLFAKKPYKFWRWGEYITNWRYKQPFIPWESVVERRGFGKLKGAKDRMQF